MRQQTLVGLATFIVIALYCVFGSTAYVCAQSPKQSGLFVLDLRDGEFSCASPREIIEICTKLLDNELTTELRIRVLAKRGDAYSASGNRDKAVVDFRTSLSLCPTNPNIELALIMAEASSPKALTDNLVALSAKYPTHLPTQLCLANHYYTTREFLAAIQWCTQSISIAGADERDLAWAYFTRAKCHYAQDQNAFSLADLDKAIEIEPLRNEDPALIYSMRADVLLRLDRPHQCLANCAMALRIDPNSFRTKCISWQSRVHLKQFHLAAQCADEIATSHGKESLSHILRARSRNIIGDHSIAIAAATRALETDAKSSAARKERAIAHECLGQFKDAISDYSTAITNENLDYEALIGKASALLNCPNESLRDDALAKQLARKACELTHWAESRCLLVLARSQAANNEFSDAASTLSRCDASSFPNKVMQSLFDETATACKNNRVYSSRIVVLNARQ